MEHDRREGTHSHPGNPHKLHQEAHAGLCQKMALRARQPTRFCRRVPERRRPSLITVVAAKLTPHGIPASRTAEESPQTRRRRADNLIVASTETCHPNGHLIPVPPPRHRTSCRALRSPPSPPSGAAAPTSKQTQHPATNARADRPRYHRSTKPPPTLCRAATPPHRVATAERSGAAAPTCKNKLEAAASTSTHPPMREASMATQRQAELPRLQRRRL